MILLALFIVFLTVVFIYHLKLRKTYKRLENIPGPPLLPFIGNASELGTNNIDVLINLKRIAKQYGRLVRLCLGPQVCILLSEPKYIAQVFNSSDSADKGDVYKMFQAVGGDGLVLASGEKWRRHRRIIEPMFSSKYLAAYMTSFNEYSNKLVVRLKSEFNNSDVSDYIHDCTMKIICNTALNVHIEDNDEFVKAFSRGFDLLLKRLFSIFKQIDFIYKFTTDYKCLQETKSIIQNYTETIIAKRKRDLGKNNQGTSRPMLLDKLLSLSRNEAFTDEEIRDEMQTMIFAGSDTIGSAISFALFELAKHPDVQQKILEETNEVLGKDKCADVSFEDAQYLRYTECVYKEILRLYPPVTFVIRKLQEGIKFDDLMIPAGAYILIFIAEAHMSEANFPNPEKFDPDRHLPENIAKRHPYAYIPFAAGPRMCIGQKYSILEAKVMLSKIIRNFEIKPVEPKHEVVFLTAGALKAANGLPVRLKMRKNL